MYQSSADFQCLDFSWRVNHVKRLISSCLQNLCPLDFAWGWGDYSRAATSTWVRQCQTAPTLTQVLTCISLLLIYVRSAWVVQLTRVVFHLDIFSICWFAVIRGHAILRTPLEAFLNMSLRSASFADANFVGRKAKLPVSKLFWSAILSGFPNYRMLE